MKLGECKVQIRKIENGYVLSWYEDNEDELFTPHVEYYAPSLDDALQRMRTLFQGQ